MLESLSPGLRIVLLLILLAFGTHRVTRVITRDRLPLICIPREWFVNRWGAYEDDSADDRKTRRAKRRVSIGGDKTNWAMASLAYLWECDWCTSIWVGAGLTYATWRWTENMFWILAALTVSTLTGLLVKLETYADKRTETLR